MRTDPLLGKLIAFEGLDGSGQTTQAKLLTHWLDAKAGVPARYTKEPSGGPIGLLLKRALAPRSPEGPEIRAISPATIALLFASDRLDHLENEVLPLLRQGILVVTDRYILSSLAYQSLELDSRWVALINRYAPPPALTLFLDVPIRVCLERIRNRHPQPELFESAAILRRVERRYRQAISRLKRRGQRIETVDGTGSIGEVHREVVEKAKAFLARSLRGKLTGGKLRYLLDAPPLEEAELTVAL